MAEISCSDLYAKADAAGQMAVARLVVQPMVVGNAKSLFSDEIDYDKPVYVVEDGPCGFAWVNVKPANSVFAKYLESAGLARKDSYLGGVCLWVSAYNQSMAKKEAYAYAFAKVLQDAGLKAYAGSRMD